MRSQDRPTAHESKESGPWPSGAQATEDDIYYAYRLLLGREPDPIGWEQLRRIVDEQHLSPEEIASGVIRSPEFAARQRDAWRVDELVEVTLDGFSLFVRASDRDIGRGIAETRAYEPHVTSVMRELLQPGDVFVDVGANIGYFTNLGASLVGPTGAVVAVEPLDKNAQLIFRSLDRNGMDNVRVNVCAASDRVGRVAIITDPGTSNGQAARPEMGGAHAVFAQTRLLDDLTADLSRIDLVKLDIEGFEPLAWRGFRKSLARHRPNVITEFHPYCMRKFANIEPTDFLDELFAYSGAISVLRASGERAAHRSREDVMAEWEQANRAAGSEGTCHLDLLVTTH